MAQDALVFSLARVALDRVQVGEPLQGQAVSKTAFSDPLGIAGRGPLEAAASGRPGTGGSGGLGFLYLGQARHSAEKKNVLLTRWHVSHSQAPRFLP